MPPKAVNRGRNVHRTTPYNETLPENWTVSRLKNELSTLGITFPSNARRSQLISLYKSDQRVDCNGAAETGERRSNETAELVRSLDKDNINNELLNVIKELSSSVNSLKKDVNDISEEMKVLKGNRNPPAAAGSAEQLMAVNREVGSPSTSTCIPSSTAEEDITLSRAYAHLNSTNSTTSVNPNQFVKTKYGYSQESLPFVETVSPTLRKNILEGKDINLAALLIPYFNVVEKKDNDRPDPRLNKQLSIAEFVSAFGIYKSIMCEVFPQRRAELDLYERDIIEMATRYTGNGFYQYHKLFSARAAAHLKYQGLPVDWSVRNNTLFCNVFANMKPITCMNCQSINHSVAFCPNMSRASSLQGRNTQLPFREGNKAMYDNNRNDTYGRPRLSYGGLEICNNFNTEKGCYRPRCNNLHVCAVCKKADHSRLQCHQNSKNVSAPKVPPKL